MKVISLMSLTEDPVHETAFIMSSYNRCLMFLESLQSLRRSAVLPFPALVGNIDAYELHLAEFLCQFPPHSSPVSEIHNRLNEV